MTCSSCEELRETIADLQETARKAGLGAQARRALEMARQYIDEGDEIDSPRVMACVLQALDIAKELAA